MEDKFRIETNEDILMEYPYTIQTRTHGEGNFNSIFLNFINSIPRQLHDDSWVQTARDVLLSQYNAISGTRLFYFKTEADRTLFLLRFS
jgi:hypothetical protein